MLYGNANIAIYFKKDSIMTKEEFFNLDYGMVVKRNQHPELYEIDETDVFGAERDGRGREYRVLGAVDKTTSVTK